MPIATTDRQRVGDYPEMDEYLRDVFAEAFELLYGPEIREIYLQEQLGDSQ